MLARFPCTSSPRPTPPASRGTDAVPSRWPSQSHSPPRPPAKTPIRCCPRRPCPNLQAELSRGLVSQRRDSVTALARLARSGRQSERQRCSLQPIQSQAGRPSSCTSGAFCRRGLGKIPWGSRGALSPREAPLGSRGGSFTGRAQSGEVETKGEEVGPREVRSEQEARELLELLVQEVRESMRLPGAAQGAGANVVAFSGGVDSSLTAFLVHRALGSLPGTLTAACIGVSPALAPWQLATARRVAEHIGVPLWEVETQEGSVPEYVENAGSSCFHCKMTLYGTLSTLAARAAQELAHHRALPSQAARSSELLGAPARTVPDQQQQEGEEEEVESEAGVQMQVGAIPQDQVEQVVLWNGTNWDDLRDPTRLGLLAALSHRVLSPLARLPKASVRAVARVAGLPNSDLAASPCLRSRLQLGVPASASHLRAVAGLEQRVRELLCLPSWVSLRVRVLHSLEATAAQAASPLLSTSTRGFASATGHGSQEEVPLSSSRTGPTSTWQAPSDPWEDEQSAAMGLGLDADRGSLQGYFVTIEVEEGFWAKAEALSHHVQATVEESGAEFAGLRVFRSGSVSLPVPY